MVGNYITKIWGEAEKEYKEKILSLIEKNPQGTMVDLGCDDGEWTMKLARAMKARKGNIYGVDVVKERYLLAKKKGIVVIDSDLNKKFPFKNGEFDFVHANQVIEHLWDLDLFAKEIKRILKKGGYAIICTENLSSWHNIFALLLGYQPFSLTNISFKGAIGNPLAFHSEDLVNDESAWKRTYGAWHHTRVLSYGGLKDIFVKHGFKVDYYSGFGYFPLPSQVASVMSSLDPRHAAFPVLKVRK
jgi:SAM-dependent methyltransferase